jgi:hypothetical protein
MQVVLGEPLAAAQERQLDDEATAHDLPAELLHEVRDRLHGAAGRQHVVVDQDARAFSDQVGVQLERVLAVLERVGGPHGLRRELPGPPGREESRADLVRDRRTEDEAPGLSAENEVRLLPARPVGEPFDRLVQGFRVSEERHDVLEDDAWLWEVRDVADQRAEVDCGHAQVAASCRSSRRKRSCASSWESSASSSRSSIPAFRRSALRERSAGATSASRRDASRFAAERNARR